LKCGTEEEWRRYVGPFVWENEVLLGVKEERNILCAHTHTHTHTHTHAQKANSIGRILRRNCLLKHAIEGNTEGIIEVMGRRRRRK